MTLPLEELERERRAKIRVSSLLSSVSNERVSTMLRQPWIVRVLALVALLLVPAVSFTQTLSTADAGAYMGTWTMSMDSPQGPFEQELALTDKGGTVVGELTNAVMPSQVITDISKTGADLVMKYEGNYQGTSFAATLTLTPDGANKAKVVFDVNGGMFTMSGSATKK
jgi:hypothetical protein